MKNVFLGILLLSAMLFAACGNDNKGQDNGITVEDSLKAENQNLNAFLDIVSISMDSINGLEKSLFVGRDGMPLSNKEQIKENLKMFKFTVDEQRARIEQLENQLAQKNDARSNKLRAIIESLKAELTEKDALIAKLQNELNQKNVDIANLNNEVNSLNNHVGELNQHVSTLNTQVGDLNQENQKKDERIAEANKEIESLSVGYVKMGKKKELSNLGLLKGGLFSKKRLDMSQVNNSLFQKINIKATTHFSIPGKEAKLMTQHPASSYSISESNGTSSLVITNPKQFWSTSHYLVIMYK